MSPKQFRLIFIITLASCALKIHAQDNAVMMDSSSHSTSVRGHLTYFVDTQGALNPAGALGLDADQWQDLTGNSQGMGFTDHAHWFKFDVKNGGSSNLELFVHLGYSLVDSIEFTAFRVANALEQTETYHVGDQFPYAQRIVDHPTFLLPFNLAPNETKRILIRIETTGTLHVPLAIWQQNSFLTQAQNTSFLYGFFLSAMLIMSAYYLCLFLLMRDPLYLLYGAFTFCIASVHACLDGYAYKWLWPNATQWHQVSAISFIGIGLIATAYFTRSALPIPKDSLLNPLMRWLGRLTIANAVISVFLAYNQAAALQGLMTIFVVSSIIIVCVAMLKHSPRIASFFCLAWLAYFAGIVLKVLTNFGHIPSTGFTEYSGNIGAIVGVIIIAQAMADRINEERQEKQAAQEESISNLKRFETLYENAIEGIFSVTQQGDLIRANPAFLKLVGLSDVNKHGGDWNRLTGYILKENSFRDLREALTKEGKVVDFETQMVNKAGASIWVNISARTTIDGAESIIEGTLVDISERKAFEQKLKHLAQHDPLTGFLNRRALEASVEKSLTDVKEHNETAFLLYLDLDQFKIVNDICGHAAGDLLLKNLSLRLLDEVKTLGTHQIIARLGGDEFAVFLTQISETIAFDSAESIRKSVEEFLFVWEGKRYKVGVSIGMVQLLPYHHSVDQILVMADSACYMAKNQGRNRVHAFVETDKELQFRQLEMQWVSNIKEALEKDQFFFVFQNIQSNTHKDEQYHYEILLRLMSANGNLCAPGQFLPAAERYNLMPDVDRWVVTHYFAWLQAHPEHLTALSCASINLSTQSIGDEKFSTFLKAAFQEYGIPGEKICFEITEGMAIVHLDNTQTFIDSFRRLGCRFALDDFGTGFSSYAYLKDLRVDYLKIDGVFLKNLVEDAVNLAMVRSIHDVAKAIGIETVAEFVENEQTRQVLIDIGINFSQGYHIHQPTRLSHNAFDTVNSQLKLR